MKRIYLLLFAALVSQNTLADPLTCKEVLNFQSRALVPASDMLPSTDVSVLAQDLIIDNDILTNRFFIAGLVQAFEQQGVELIESSYLKKNMEFVGAKPDIFKVRFYDDYDRVSLLKAHIKTLSPANKRVIAYDAIKNVRAALYQKSNSTIAEDLKWAEAFKGISEEELALTIRYLGKYDQRYDNQIVDSFAHLLSGDYFAIVRLRATSPVTQFRRDSESFERRFFGSVAAGVLGFLGSGIGGEALIEPLFNLGLFKNGALTTVYLVSGMAVPAFITDLVTRRRIRNELAAYVPPSVEARQAALKTMISAGFIEGEIIDVDGGVVDEHPLIESDGVVISVTETQSLEDMARLLGGELPTMTPSLTSAPNANELLTFGSHLDKGVTIVSRLMFDRLKFFTELVRELPERLGSYNELVRMLSNKENGDAEDQARNIEKLRDYAEDFGKMHQSIELIIGALDFLVTHTEKLAIQFESHKKVLEGFKISDAFQNLNAIQQDAFETRLKAIRLHWLTSVSISESYILLAKKVMRAHQALGNTSLMLANVQSLTASGFDEGRAGEITDDIDLLVTTFNQMTGELEADLVKAQSVEDEVMEGE